MSATLTDTQLQTLRQWAEEGKDLNAIQKALAEEMGIHLTYMDTRFLLIDKGINLQPAPEPAPAAPAAPAPAASAPSNQLQVTVDELQQPGVFLSGKVSFPSGATGSWLFDSTGQLSWEPGLGEPTPAEMADFQKELGRILRSRLGHI